MAKIKNKLQLEKAIRGIAKIQGVDSVDVDEFFKNQVYLLRICIENEIENYYSSYTPQSYPRTFDMLNSLEIDGLYSNKNYYRMRIYFNDRAYKNSVIAPHHDLGFTPLLINEGWEWRDPSKYKGTITDRVRDHFISYKGYHFVEKGIGTWEVRHKAYGFTVTVYKMHTGQGMNINEIQTYK